MKRFIVAIVGVFLLLLGRGQTANSAFAKPLEPLNCVEDVFAPNHILADAAFYQGGVVQGQTCQPLGDVDYFKFLAAEGANLEITLTFTHATSDLDLRLFDENLDPVAQSNTTTDNEAISYVVPSGEAGIYYVEIDDFDANDNSYTLEITGMIDCASPFSVSTTADLNQGIVCFNQQTSADDYQLELAGNLTLDAATTAVNNTSTNSPLLHLTGGYSDLSLSGGAVYQILSITSGRVLVDRLTLVNARGGLGAAISNQGQLFVTNTTFSSNIATTSGGAIYNNGGTVSISNSTFFNNQATNSAGGAILTNGGSVKVVNSTFGSNTAGSSGGAISAAGGTVELIHSTISNSGNDGLNVSAGSATVNSSILANSTSGSDCAVGGTGAVTVSHSLIEDGGCNAAGGTNNLTGDPLLEAFPSDHGGATETMALLDGSPAVDAANAVDCNGIDVENKDQRGVRRPQGPACDMGAYEKQSCSVTDWTVDTSSELITAIDCFNQATSGTYSITLDGPIILESEMPDVSNSSVALQLSGSTLDGANRYRGFSIENTQASIGEMTIQNMVSGNGGAVFVRGSQTVDLTSVILKNNRAETGGGMATAIGTTTNLSQVVFENNQADIGGAVYNFGTQTIDKGTFKNNSATFTGGAILTDASLTIDTSTLYGNSGQNGVVAVQNNGSLTLKNSTLANNNPTNSEGTIYFFANSEGTIVNSIVAFSSGSECTQESNVNLTISHTLMEDGSCNAVGGASGNLNGDPLLGPLVQNSAVPADFYPLLANSPAIDAANNSQCNGADQRLLARPQGAACDMGAYEVQIFTVYLPTIRR